MRIRHLAIAIGLIVVFFLCILAVLGFLPFNFLGLGDYGGGDDMPQDADFCVFTDGQILDMIETLIDKNLNEQIGLGYVDALNMKACGSDSWTIEGVRSEYNNMYTDYYLYAEQTTSGSGYSALGPSAESHRQMLETAYRVLDWVTVSLILGAPAWGVLWAWLYVRLSNRLFAGIRPQCCSNCGYDLTANVSGVCPECGNKTSANRDVDEGTLS